MSGRDCVSLAALIIIIALLVGAAVACVVFSRPQLDEGIVTNKRYDPENTMLYWRSAGKIGYWQQVIDDEDWILRVRGETAEGKTREEEWEVSREKWEAVQIGDRVTREGRG